MNFRLTIMFFFFTPLIFGQTNLVSNPSFEQYTSCPNNISQFNYATGWNNCGGTPDYFNTCALTSSYISIPTNAFGFQYPSSPECHAYAGFYGKCIWSNCREYIGTELITPMTINFKYFFSVKINLVNTSNCGINKLGVIFSTVSHIDSTGLSPLTSNFAHIYSTTIIDDTVNWVSLAGSFVADSAYKFMIFGHFFDDAHTDSVMLNGDILCQAYYLLDDFCVSTDSSFCYNYSYNCGVGINDYSKDNIKIFPNPATSELTIDLTIPDNYIFEIYDLLGANRFSVRLDSGSQTVDLTDVDSGVYVYTIVDNKGNKIKTDKLIIIK